MSYRINTNSENIGKNNKNEINYIGYSYIYTIGCQMNSYDSEKIASILDNIGYLKTDKLEQADIVVCNTCSIREKAQEKAFSFLGTLANKKLKNPNLISIMSGCVAQQEGEKVFKRIPHLDIVMGTQAFARLPNLIKLVQLSKKEPNAKKHIVDIEDSAKIFESMPYFSKPDFSQSHFEENANSFNFKVKKDRFEVKNDKYGAKEENFEDKKVSRFVTIMQGCDNFCTYCIVPYVRGRERSRTPQSIVQEIKILADSGVKEVTLLGQNVNSYGKYNIEKKIIKEDGLPQNGGVFQQDHQKNCTFPELLAKINEINGIERIRFATSHPKDISDELIFAIRDLKKVCNQLHLPVQSGSNAILKKMNRGYTREKYLERISTLRTHCPNIGLSSDMIVGFPSESREDFEQTLDLIKTVEFDGLFAFSYSDRPNAPAAKFSGAVDEEEKMARLNELLSLQEYYTQKKNQALVGTVQAVLVEGKSLKNRHSDKLEIEANRLQMTGRTESGKIVHFYADNINQGQIVGVYIENAYPHSLWGNLVEADNETRI
ncbi:MAG: tRNA (N6-isopentenyl adenosine(37)-C2)-methylthiotransferase MiaB [Desulfamplus sp.]|nr:tRNA (N6-isopentenyl adenosine(37)-C2)-methylthiotransferase MiaB [Desulfamplus sp.]